MIRGAALALLLLLAQPAHAQEPPELVPRTAQTLRDPDFRVESRAFGLDRQVEMYQWRRTDSGYEQVWNAAAIDATGFEPGRENPPRLPIEGERWWSDTVTINGARVAPDVLRVLGEWKAFRPSFSRLPANLAATFQPDGDGLSSSENPLAPQVGDLRITWRELALPPLQGQVELRDGVWQLVPGAAAVPVALPEPEEPVEVEPGRLSSVAMFLLWAVGGVVALALVALVTIRRRRGHRAR